MDCTQKCTDYTLLGITEKSFCSYILHKSLSTLYIFFIIKLVEYVFFQVDLVSLTNLFLLIHALTIIFLLSFWSFFEFRLLFLVFRFMLFSTIFKSLLFLSDS